MDKPTLKLNIKAIFFDLGNVLVSFSHQKMLERLANLSKLPEKQIEKLFLLTGIGKDYENGSLTTRQVFELFSKKSPEKLHYPQFVQAACEIFSPITQTVELLPKLKQKGLKLFLLSNTSKIHFQFIKENYSFLHYLDGTILSFEEGVSKPNRAIYQKALERANLESFECYFVDDQEDNIFAAKSVGLHCHHFTSPDSFISELKNINLL